MSENDQIDQDELIQRVVAETAGDQPEEISPEMDDQDADADIARPSRVMQYRVQRRAQFSMTLPALLLIAIGGAYVVSLLAPDTLQITPLMALAAALGATALGLLARFLINGRKETGVLFISLVLVLWIALGALAVTGIIDLMVNWPMAISAVGVAIIIMMVFIPERGLLLPGLALIVAGVTLLMFTTGTVDVASVTTIAQYWPVLLILVGLVFLPSAFRNRTR
ncbi:MAG: hypothetical protein KF716_01640 [Anaerolineae bacterium]|nr:hypothetical protein [Anaerolineae bacterium]